MDRGEAEDEPPSPAARNTAQTQELRDCVLSVKKPQDFPATSLRHMYSLEFTIMEISKNWDKVFIIDIRTCLLRNALPFRGEVIRDESGVYYLAVFHSSVTILLTGLFRNIEMMTFCPKRCPFLFYQNALWWKKMVL